MVICLFLTYSNFHGNNILFLHLNYKREIFFNRKKTAIMTDQKRNLNSSITSRLHSSEIIEVIQKDKNAFGICRGNPLTDSGRRQQLVKIIILTLLPITALMSFAVYDLNDTLQDISDVEETISAVKISVELGKFLDRIQRERDMSVLYFSILGPQTKTFLVNEYLLTDQALDRLSTWPLKMEKMSVFYSKAKFQLFLNQHRQSLDQKAFAMYDEIAFYNYLIDPFVEWFYDAIIESRMTSMWKILVSYNKIVTSVEQIGIERALGVIFYVNGKFPNQNIYEMYNSNVNIFRSNYRSAVSYWQEIDAIFQKGVSKHGTNLTAVIEKFRFEIQHFETIEPSVLKAQWWFDNMTLYLDSLLVIQEDLAKVVNGKLETRIRQEEEKLITCIVILVVVLLVCPVVIFLVHALTTDVQKYARTLVVKIKELHKKMKTSDSLLYQMVPKAIADKLKANHNVDAEYFKSVTIMFSEIENFTNIVTACTPFEIVHMLNSLYTAFDDKLANHEVYKVETINDSYMVVSGLSIRIKEQHSFEIASLALDFATMISQRSFINHGDMVILLKIGINTGPCMAGIVGTIMPRYCLFGDTVNTASRMKSYGFPGKIHLSDSTYNSLKKNGLFRMTAREPILVKGKGLMQTYWLEGTISAPIEEEDGTEEQY